MTETFKGIFLKDIQESKNNPRKSFDKAYMDDLAASIKEKGIINPIMVRQVNSHYEIVCGARRFRAAQMVGLDTVPAIVREMTDEEALEVSTIENLQREGVHPLEEAEGYQRLLKAKNGDVRAVAGKVGKSVSYIYGRLALNNLSEHSRKAWLAGKMDLGHALLVARLQPEEQKRAVSEELGGRGATVSELKRYVQEELLLGLSAAPWKKDDETLLSRAGSCNACPKRTGKNPELFQDFGKEDKCLDGACYRAKMEAFMVRKRLELKKEGATVKDITLDYYSGRDRVLGRDHYRDWKGCDKPITGLIVEGKGLGTTKKICLTPDCKKCNPGRSVSHNDFARQTGPERYKRRLEIWENKIAQETRIRLRAAVLPLIKGPVKRWHLLALLRETMDAVHLKYGDSFEDHAKLVGVKWPKWQRGLELDDIKQAEKVLAKYSDDDILRFTFAIAVERDMIVDPSRGGNDIEVLTPLIKLHGAGKIDAAKIEAAVRKELEAKKPKPPKPEPKKPAAKKKGKRK